MLLFLIGLLYGVFKNYNHDSKSIGSFDLSGGKYVRLVFIGSSDCFYSNNTETHKMIRYIKSELNNVLKDSSIQFISTGISYDHSPEVAINYLNKTGSYDELLVGAGPFNLGVINYVSGSSSTPKVLLFFEKYESDLFGLNLKNILASQNPIQTYTGQFEIQSLYEFVSYSSDKEIIEYLGIE